MGEPDSYHVKCCRSTTESMVFDNGYYYYTMVYHSMKGVWCYEQEEKPKETARLPCILYCYYCSANTGIIGLLM